ncbi:MAG: CpsD/CapB family tyrosine-protein kinase [Clostridia bacterium]|nr:CpsD/CapB family tyrosine-protein kinase [Clostridia bacterium]
MNKKTQKLETKVDTVNNSSATPEKSDTSGLIFAPRTKALSLDKQTIALVNESYKAIRTNIILSVIKNECKKIVVVSSVPGEGKSTTAANIAISLAQTDKKVLIIDADFRRPSLYKIMELNNAPGVTNVLTGLASIEEAINHTAYPNLDVLCAGISVPNPSELLACETTNNLISMMEEKYDYIIFDTPPLNAVSDALPLIRISDGTVMVVRHNISTTPELDKAIQSINFIGGKIIGFVYNATKGEKSRSYDAYRYNSKRDLPAHKKKSFLFKK